jgi:aminoglycoside/choline kinase family phosphotransferase
VTARDEARDAFLARNGLARADAAPLAGDASPRRYFRLPSGLVLMDADPALGMEVGRFAALTGWLRALGLSAPAVHDADLGAGFLLLEDLGDALFARVAVDPATEAEAYAATVDVLLRVQAEPPPTRVEAFGAAAEPIPYDFDVLAREARLALEWWALAAGAAPEPDAAAEFDALLREALSGPAADRRALVLLDYHAENLIWLPHRSGLARVGLLDYQDARIGSPAYDLASLIADARRDVRPDLAAALVDRYAAAQGPGFDRARFVADLAALSAQRNLKILGLFTRLARRDGKPGYLKLLPRVWRNLTVDLAHPALSDLRAFVLARLPAPEPAALARAGA